MALPLIVGWAFSTFRGLMESVFLSIVPEKASLSAYDYAKTLCDPLVTFIPYAFGIALFPFLTDIAVAGNKERLHSMLLSATRMMMLIFIPLALGIIIFRYPIILSLYGSHAFTRHSADLTAAPLLILAIGMLASALEIIVNQFYFAMSDTIRPTVTGMVMIPIYATVGFFGVTTMGWGAAAVALAMLCYRTAKVIALYTMIRKKIGTLNVGSLLALFGKLAVSLVPFVGILLIGGHFLPQPENVEGKIAKLLMLLPYMLTGGVGVVLYLTALHFLHVDEVAMIVGKVRAKILRRPSTV